MFELSDYQLLILGFAASLLTMLLRFVVEFLRKQKIELPTWVQNIIVFAVATGLAVAWMPMVFPPFPAPVGDPAVDVPAFLAFFGAAVAQLTLTLSFAVFVYNALLARVVKPVLRKIALRQFPAR